MKNFSIENPKFFVLSENGYRGPKYWRMRRRLGPLVKAVPPTRQAVDSTNLAVTSRIIEAGKGRIYQVSARDTTKAGSPKAKVAVLETSDVNVFEDLPPTDFSPIDFSLSILFRRLGEWEGPAAPLGLGVSKSPTPEVTATEIETFMRKTRYWSGKRMQEVTPDNLVINEIVGQQLVEFVRLETEFLNNVLTQYTNNVRATKESELVTFLEGDLAGAPLMKVLRSWVEAAPKNQPPVNYFRPDMGVTVDSSNQLQLTSYEINIETAGTPPAVLYRLASKPSFEQRGLEPFAPGSDVLIPEVFAEKQPEPVLAIVGVTPGKSSQFLYEKGQQDLAEILTNNGLPSAFTRITDLEVRNGRLFLPEITSPISTVFWRVQPFRQDTLSELTSAQGELLKQLYRDEDVTIFPVPCLPFLDNKNLEALVWDDRFSPLVPSGLRKYVPRTERLTPDSQTAQSIRENQAEWKRFIIKRAVGAGGGIIIGAETKRQEFIKYLNSETSSPPKAVLQEFVPPATFSLRTVDESEKTREKKFYIRIEPTVICPTVDRPQIADLFFTGRSDSRLVAGNLKSIMGTICVAKSP